MKKKEDKKIVFDFVFLFLFCVFSRPFAGKKSFLLTLQQP